MKKERPYLITAQTQDGDHEYRSHAIIFAANSPKAQKIAEDSMAPDTGLNPPPDYWGFGDGQTETQLVSVQELTMEQAQMLDNLRVAYAMTRDDSRKLHGNMEEITV